MRKVFLVLTASLLCFYATAQNETIIEVQNQKGPYVTNGFWDNWFISAGGGVQIYFGESDTYGDFGKRLAPALDISVGKWLTPAVGMRFQYAGLKAKGWSNGVLPYSDAAEGDGYYKEKFNVMNLHADFLWNISNAIGGERVDRFWNFIPYVGVGWARSEANDTHQNEIAATVGLLHNLRLSDAIDLNIDMRSMFVNRRFAQSNGGKTLNALGTVTAGITYKFNTRGFQRASDLIVVEDNTEYVEEIAYLQRMLDQANTKRAKLEQDLATQMMAAQEADGEVVQVPVLPDMAIFFEIGKANLTEKAMINIGYLADIIKQYPDKQYVIFASADKETGTPEFNMKLSQKRGEAVQKVLVEKFGVNPAQLTIQAVGSSEQKFDGAQLNRVVVIEDVE